MSIENSASHEVPSNVDDLASSLGFDPGRAVLEFFTKMPPSLRGGKVSEENPEGKLTLGS